MNPSLPHSAPDAELDRLLSGAVDDVLEPEEELRLVERLEASEADRRSYLRYVTMHGSLHYEYAEAAATQVVPFEAPGSDPTPESLFSRKGIAISLAAAAVVLGCLAYLLMPWENSTSLVSVAYAEGALYHGTDERQALRAGDRLAPGLIRVESESGLARLAFDDGTEITLGGGAEIVILESETGKRLELREGRLDAEVTPQPAGKPLRILTETAETVVLGTRFFLVAWEGHTDLVVEEGAVRSHRLTDGASLEVTAGRQVRVGLDPGEPLVDTPQAVPGSAWALHFGSPRDPTLTKGAAVSVAGVPCLEAVPYIAGRNEDGSKTVRAGISVNGDLARIEADSVIRLRYRSDWGPTLFLGTREPGGKFGGNFEYHLDLEGFAPGVDGWTEAEVPLSAFEAVAGMRDRRDGIEPGISLSKILVSVHSGHRLQLSRLELE